MLLILAVRYLAVAFKSVWDGIRTATPGDKELNHRKVLFIFWFMSGIKKCVLFPLHHTLYDTSKLTDMWLSLSKHRCIVLWEADSTLTLALTTACQSASYLEYFLMYWPATRAYQLAYATSR